MDNEINSFGRKLKQFIDDNQLVICNGRFGNQSSQYTFETAS